MHKIFGSGFVCLVSVASAIAQDPAAIDSTKILNEVVIQAYAYKRPAEEVPAAVAVVSQKDFERFSNSTLLPTANTIPGVRMEERSPGSYRFSIRGSLLRSPFGVRNVKVYWNGLPFTDGGGKCMGRRQSKDKLPLQCVATHSRLVTVSTRPLTRILKTHVGLFLMDVSGEYPASKSIAPGDG